MTKAEMTPRQRWLALFNRQRPDRIPTDYWATGEVNTRLMRDLKCASMDEVYVRLHIDRPRVLGAGLTRHNHPDEPQADIWGVRSRTIAYGTGEYSEFASHPLAHVETVEQVHAFRWPDPDDVHDFNTYAKEIKSAPDDRLIRVAAYEPFLLYAAMRGMEQAMMDLLAEPDIADAILAHIFDYYYRFNTRMWEIGQGRIDLTYVAEDLGSQSSLLFGLEQIRRFLLPNQKKMADQARRYGIHIFYHTDGSARLAIPELLSVTGIEVLNPIQWRCPGMEREGLVRDFGSRLIFHGAMDNQQTMPFGTVEDVRQEVLDNIRIFSPARWVCAPCHNLQAVSPTANIITLYETIHEHGRLE
jgi:uroporphyrinogen decarboxylase